MRGNLTVSEMQATFASMTPTRLDSSAWGHMINNSKLNLIKNLFLTIPTQKKQHILYNEMKKHVSFV
jgi:hypothetical protein